MNDDEKLRNAVQENYKFTIQLECKGDRPVKELPDLTQYRGKIRAFLQVEIDHLEEIIHAIETTWQTFSEGLKPRSIEHSLDDLLDKFSASITLTDAKKWAKAIVSKLHEAQSIHHASAMRLWKAHIADLKQMLEDLKTYTDSQPVAARRHDEDNVEEIQAEHAQSEQPDTPTRSGSPMKH